MKRFVAFDQDQDSLAVVRSHGNRYASLETIQGSIVDLIKGRDIGKFDLIYSAGLYDYLSMKIARKLTAALFSRLNPGGCLLIGNFLDGIRDRGYMEICMDWSLIFRNQTNIIGFSNDIIDQEVQSMSYFTDPVRNVGYLEIQRVA